MSIKEIRSFFILFKPTYLQLAAILLIIFNYTESQAQLIEVQSTWKKVGRLKNRSAKQIKSSTWSIGAETLDRDYTNYQAYKSYLGPLGAKRIRLQGGWAKCEKVKGQYDFSWLDIVVKDAVSQGMAPWIELSYGNPIYEGGGEAKLGGGLPVSAGALAAWDNWVRAMVNRYKSQVNEWEIWNEPDLSGKKISGEQYADFYIRTAILVRQLQPTARLLAFGLCNPNRRDFVEPLFIKLKKEDKLNLVDVLTYHGYNGNPDITYPMIEKLRKMVWQYKPEVIFMQGENGAPSTPKEITIGALKEFDWSELTQAKWDLRRMLGDHGRSIATNLFTISDIHYAAGDHMKGVNTKGLLKTNPDKSIDRPKMAYLAAQNVFSLFDDQLEVLKANKPVVGQKQIAVFGYQNKKNKGALVTLWCNEARPEDLYPPKAVTITIQGLIKQPVFVDLISGFVYDIPSGHWQKTGDSTVFTNIPVADYPVAIAEKSVLLTTRK